MNDWLSHIRSILLWYETEICQTIIGQKDLIRKLLIALFSWWHVLIEWVPWLGKTKTVKTLASILGYEWKRISFTPDLLPSDLVGSEIYRPQTAKFETRKWPIFTHLLLADEINRTPPKVQSALLEAMEENHVTIGNETLALPAPFFVIATQNPLEHEGTYPLPEAELDRFMMKLLIDYPSREDEIRILQTNTSWKDTDKKNTKQDIPPSLSPTEFLEMRDYIAKNIHTEEPLVEYISRLLEATRPWSSDKNQISKSQDWKSWVIESENFHHLFREKKNSLHSHTSYLSYWASTRAGIAFLTGAKVSALFHERDYATPDDVKYIAHDILRHRIGLSYEAISDGITSDEVIERILDTTAL